MSAHPHRNAGWLEQRDRNMPQFLHHVPMGDHVVHELGAFDECVCGPTVVFDQRTGGGTVRHHPLDEREGTIIDPVIP